MFLRDQLHLVWDMVGSRHLFSMSCHHRSSLLLNVCLFVPDVLYDPRKLCDLRGDECSFVYGEVRLLLARPSEAYFDAMNGA